MFLLLVISVIFSLCWSEPILQVDKNINGKVFKSIHGIGPRMCFEECKANSIHCGTANYNTVQLTCTLVFKENLGKEGNSTDQDSSENDNGVDCQGCGMISKCIKASYTDISTCVNLGCTEGEYLDGSTCEPCPAGKYKDTIGTSPCLGCPKGHYQPEVGQVKCLPCPAGHHQNRKGKTSCMTCEEGTYIAETGATECTSTSPGYYQDKLGQTSPIPCPAGTYQDQHRQYKCAACPPGSYQHMEGQSFCIACPQGYHQPDTGSSSRCRPCPAGTYQNITASPSCEPCPEGTYQSEEGRTTCVNCPTEQCLVMGDRKMCLSKSDDFEFVGYLFPVEKDVRIGNYSIKSCDDECSSDDTCIEYLADKIHKNCSKIRRYGLTYVNHKLYQLYRRKEC